MKKILLLSIIVISFISCGYNPIEAHNDIIITRMESCKLDANLMHYYGKTKEAFHVWTIADDNFCIVDSVNKYQIGDTLEFVVK